MKIVARKPKSDEFIVVMSRSEIECITGEDGYSKTFEGMSFNVKKQWENLRKAEVIATFKETISRHFSNILNNIDTLSLEKLYEKEQGDDS